jgi:hypothetical protein
MVMIDIQTLYFLYFFDLNVQLRNSISEAAYSVYCRPRRRRVEKCAYCGGPLEGATLRHFQ